MPRVLVIDDEPRVVRALEFALLGRGFEFVALGRVDDVDQLAQADLPDAILLDVGLGTESGIDLCRRLKDHARLGSVPLLLLSGQIDAATQEAGFDAGADDFVTKPFAPDDLLVRINAQLRRRSST